MPKSGLHIIGEHFEPVNHHLLAVPSASLATIKTVRSHVHALSQCRDLIRALGVQPVVAADTAGAAAEIAARRDPSVAAIASELAGQIYGLVSLKENIEDAEHNTTRFLIMSRAAVRPSRDTPAVTTFLFRVRNVPAALYKALGGFATNGVNMTKLESYMVGGAFTATQFYADVEGHPEDRPVALALEELAFFSRELKIPRRLRRASVAACRLSRAGINRGAARSDLPERRGELIMFTAIAQSGRGFLAAATLGLVWRWPGRLLLIAAAAATIGRTRQPAARARSGTAAARNASRLKMVLSLTRR